jgi:neutral ceramidase
VNSARLALLIPLAVLVSFAVDQSASQADELRAGIAKIDITPPLELKASLGGYGDRMNRPATGVHDRLMAKALVLTDGHKKFCLMTVDALGFAPSLKTAVLDRLTDKGWTSDNLMMLASHSHTAIEMNNLNPLNVFQIPQMGIHNPQLFEVITHRFAQVVIEAEKTLVPITVGVSSIELHGWNRNRRIPGGIVDPELTVVRVDRLDGKPFAVFVNWTCHPTFMGPHDMLFSGDYPGQMQRTLEALIGDGVVAMFCNGAEGDQSYIPRPDSGDARWEKAERYGRELGIQAWHVWQKTATTRNVAFAFHQEEIDLPKRQWSPNFRETGGKEYGLTEDVLREMLPKMWPARSESISLRLGDLLIVGIPGELCTQMGLQVKHRAKEITGAAHPIIGGLADEWIGYIVPIEQYKMGKYEASMSFYGPTLADVIVTSVIRGVEHLQEQKLSANR